MGIKKKTGNKRHYMNLILKRTISKCGQITQGIIESLKSSLSAREKHYWHLHLSSPKGHRSRNYYIDIVEETVDA